ncbi:MAG: hypothetical protein NT141_03655 [candidate division WWE3 bacterium]|nr:hypothetical protein [candidate division WWE3 bacterium]
MDHIAIMKKEWGLLPKILSGVKTVEARWYKSKIAPWGKIKAGDTIYFKDSGGPVSVKAAVTNVTQYEITSNQQALEIMSQYAIDDLGTSEIPESVKNYITEKKYAIFVRFDRVEKITPFEVDKTGFGLQCVWMRVENIKNRTNL